VEKIKFVIFDLDGVFYRGFTPLSGGKEMLDFLQKNGIGYCFLTNNSSHPPYMYIEKLKDFGLDVYENQIITTSMIMDRYLDLHNISNIHILGSTHLKNALKSRICKKNEIPTALIVGMDDSINMADISYALNRCDANTQIIATNGDYFIPRDGHFDLECGAILDILCKALNRPHIIVGKPSPFAFDFALECYGAARNSTLMVGDTYETDIKGALDSRLQAAWIATGNTLPKHDNSTKFTRHSDLNDLIQNWLKL
jgi:HAD superfamily hydrolase (TIGR01450 family)